MCWKSFKAEFTKANLLLDYGQPDVFAQPVCRRHSIIFVGYRLLVPAYLWGILIYSFVQSGAKLLVTFTYWSYIVLCVTSSLQAGTAVYQYILSRKGKDLPEGMPAVYRIQWVGCNIVMVAAPGLVLVYWILLYEGEVVTVTNATVHGANAIYALQDRCFTALPVRLLHVWHVMLYGAVYAVFTALHFAAGGDPIYPQVDYYNAPGWAVAFLLGLILIIAPLGHLLMYLLTVAREAIRERCGGCHGRSSVDVNTVPSICKDGQELEHQPPPDSSSMELGVDNPALQSDTELDNNDTVSYL